MQLPPERINQIRGIATWTIRAAAMILVSTGIYLVLKRLMLGAAIGDFAFPFTIYTDVGEASSMHRGLAMLIIGALLGILSGPISAWVVAMPPEACPRCGHPQPPGGTARCTECGLQWRDGTGGASASP